LPGRLPWQSALAERDRASAQLLLAGASAALPGMETLEPDSAACSRSSCWGESEDRITLPRNRDISFSTLSGCALRTSTNKAELFSFRVWPRFLMKSSSMP